MTKKIRLNNADECTSFYNLIADAQGEVDVKIGAKDIDGRNFLELVNLVCSNMNYKEAYVTYLGYNEEDIKNFWNSIEMFVEREVA